MIELTMSRPDYGELVRKYKLINDHEPTGRLYREHVGQPKSTDRACNCGSDMCKDRKAGCAPSKCCTLEVKYGSCADCDTPCAVLRALAEVLP